MELDGVLEHHQVHEIIQQEDGTITEVYYYQPVSQYEEQESTQEHQYSHEAIIVQPEDIKTEPAHVICV